MSKKSRSRNIRDIRNIARLPRLDLRFKPRLDFGMSEIEDNRRYHPLGALRPSASFTISNHRLEITPSPHRLRLPSSVRFAFPSEVIRCARRTIRKQVMFAKGGAGKKKMRRPKRNEYSDVRC